MASSNPPPRRNTSQSSSITTIYLLAYNLVSACLWGTVLGRVAMILSNEGVKTPEKGKVYGELEEFVRLTQSLAGLEILHSLVGIVRTPIFTAFLQVASRLLLTWGIAYNFPQTTRYSPAYTSMLVAWSVTEVIRYSYFVFVLSGMGVPGLLSWLRYNTFLILYPLGVGSETWLVFKAIQPAEKMDKNYGYVLWGLLAVYIPGFYMLFTHMLSQRRRIMSGRNKTKLT